MGGKQPTLIKGSYREKFRYKAESMLGKTMGKIFPSFLQFFSQFSIGIFQILEVFFS